MDTPTCEALAQFCADQRYAFDARAWWTRARSEKSAVAVAARYLSMTSWYGHEDELKEIADASADIGASACLQRESQAAGLDLARFSVAVRSVIALRRLHPTDGIDWRTTNAALRTSILPRRQELVD